MAYTSVRAGSMLMTMSVLAACGETRFGPESELQGSYELTSVDAQPLPVPLWSENGQTLWLLGETIGFDGKGAATRVFSWRRDSLDVIGVAAQTVTHRSGYRVRADSLVLGHFTCPPNALCPLPEFGVFSQDSVLLERPVYGGRLFRYEHRSQL